MKPRALIVGDRRKAGVTEGVEGALPALRARLDVAGVDLDGKTDLAAARADLILVFGGDGSFLHVADRLGTNPTPVLGVNYGRFGYLAELQPEELEAGIDAYVAGRFTVLERARLRCVHREGRVARSEVLALNDVVVGRRTLGRMLDVEVRIDGREAISVSGDGLIVATPSGSTAHALSAGGPILEPTIPAMVLVPVCPHALGTRPLLVPLSSRVELRAHATRPPAVVTVDGREPIDLAPSATVEVEDARSPLRVVCVSGRSYYDSLRVKFGWAGRPNYRPDAAPTLAEGTPTPPAAPGRAPAGRDGAASNPRRPSGAPRVGKRPK